MSAEKQKKLSHYASKRAGQTKPGPAGQLRPLIDSLRVSLGMCSCRPMFAQSEGWLCSTCAPVIKRLNPPRPVTP